MSNHWKRTGLSPKAALTQKGVDTPDIAVRIFREREKRRGSRCKLPRPGEDYFSSNARGIDDEEPVRKAQFTDE